MTSLRHEMTGQVALTVIGGLPAAVKVIVAWPLLSFEASTTETVTDWFGARVPDAGVTVT